MRKSQRQQYFKNLIKVSTQYMCYPLDAKLSTEQITSYEKGYKKPISSDCYEVVSLARNLFSRKK